MCIKYSLSDKALDDFVDEPIKILKNPFTYPLLWITFLFIGRKKFRDKKHFYLLDQGQWYRKKIRDVLFSIITLSLYQSKKINRETLDEIKEFYNYAKEDLNAN